MTTGPLPLLNASTAEQLSIKTRQLALILAIDRIRDGAADERELAAAIVSTLADAVEAELCLLCLRDDDSGQLQVRALTDRASVYGDLGAEQHLRDLAQRAADLTSAQILHTDLAIDQRRHSYCVAAPLRVAGASLGALLLLNADRPFDHAELAVVDAAISQIDSAMQHARTLRELQRRQVELETIFRIDRLRDRTADSGQVLPQILSKVVEPAIFWLDGHYSAGFTAKGDKDCPIYEELDAIFKYKNLNHILLIDDARCFDGTGDYPTISDLSLFIKNVNDNYKIEVKYDIIRCTI